MRESEEYMQSKFKLVMLFQTNGYIRYLFLIYRLTVCFLGIKSQGVERAKTIYI